MYISRVYIKNFRNFDEFDLFIPDGEPLTFIGGNNSGKTNFLQAIRLVLDSSIPSWERRLSENDFCWLKDDACWTKGSEIIITVTFSNVTNKEEIKALLHSIAPASSDENGAQDSLDANISFVFAPATFNKGGSFDIDDDYVSFLVAGRYHPSGSYYLSDGTMREYDSNIISSLHACDSKEEFYKYFYLSADDIEKIRENKEVSFEKQLTKQVYANKIRKHINILFLDALRDVKNDFYQGYNSLVSQLIRGAVQNGKSNKIFEEITGALKTLRTAGSTPEANLIIEEIESRLQNEKVNLLTDKAELVISTPKITPENVGRYFNFLVNLNEGIKKDALDLKVVGLGFQNLAYISAIFTLFELKKEIYINDSDEKIKIIYNLLLIEEPEAHLDVQNQKFLHTQIENKTEKLMDDFSSNGDEPTPEKSKFFAFTQVLQTSHSTHLASKSDLKNIVVIQKNIKQTSAINIDSILQLESETYKHRRRILKQYLDATRSALLFARKVVLVEGLSEKYALGTILNSYLRKNKPQIKNLDIDSEGIEIVEVGGKNFDPFVALFNSGADGLRNKCLSLHDGDYQLKEDADFSNYKNIHDSLNVIDVTTSANIFSRSNIFTFEVETYFIPDPEKPSLNNIEYLKLILYRFMKDGDYFKKDKTFEKKIEIINSTATAIGSNKIDKEKIGAFFDEILGYEVSKPNLSLYLSSLLKAKLLNDSVEIEAWSNGYSPDDIVGISKFENLPDFVIPKYIEEGLLWLITE